MRTPCLLLFFSLIVIVPVQSIEEPGSESSHNEKVNGPEKGRPADSVKYGGWSTAASIFPGTVLHGSGHFVAGDTDAALMLLKYEGLSILTLAAGGVPFAISGASDKTNWITIPVLAAGLGGFLYTMSLNWYGAANGGRLAKPRTGRDPEINLGYANYSNAELAIEHVVNANATFYHGQFQFTPQVAMSPGASYQNYFLESKWQLLGSEGFWPLEKNDTSYVNLGTSVDYQRFSDFGASISAAELFFDFRYQLDRLHHTFSGSYAETEFGYSTIFYGFDSTGNLFEDHNHSLVIRFVFGFVFEVGKSEFDWSMFYDHKRYTLVGGIPGGVAGYFGSALKFTMSTIIARLEVASGSALATQFSLGYRF